MTISFADTERPRWTCRLICTKSLEFVPAGNEVLLLCLLCPFVALLVFEQVSLRNLAPVCVCVCACACVSVFVDGSTRSFTVWRPRSCATWHACSPGCSTRTRAPGVLLSAFISMRTKPRPPVVSLSRFSSRSFQNTWDCPSSTLASKIRKSQAK